MLLSTGSNSLFRALTARMNYIAQDRADLVFASSCVSHFMSEPTPAVWRTLKRTGRYLIGAACLIHEMVLMPSERKNRLIKVRMEGRWPVAEDIRQHHVVDGNVRQYTIIDALGQSNPIRNMTTGESQTEGALIMRPVSGNSPQRSPREQALDKTEAGAYKARMQLLAPTGQRSALDTNCDNSNTLIWTVFLFADVAPTSLHIRSTASTDGSAESTALDKYTAHK